MIDFYNIYLQYSIIRTNSNVLIEPELLIEIKNGLDEAGIEMPYPHRTVNFAKDHGV